MNTSIKSVLSTSTSGAISRKGGISSLAIIAAAGAAASIGSVASGQTWVGPTGNWSAAGNWIGGVPSSGTSTALIFNGSGAAVTATNDIGVFILNSLTNNTSSSGFLIPATNSLTFDGTSPAIVNNGRGVFTIASSALLNATTAISGSGPGNIALNGVLSGGGGLTIGTTPSIVTTGMVVLGGANTFSGGVTLNSGNLRLANNGALGTGTFTVGGSSVFDIGSTVTPTASSYAINNALRITGSGALTLNNAITGSGAITLNTTSAMVVTSNSTGYTGVFNVERSIIPANSTAPTGITLSGLNGAMINVPTWNIRGGGVLNLSNASSAVNSNRIGDAAAINLGSGSLTVNTNASAVNEVVGAISGSGYNTIGMTVSSGTLPAQISATSLSRTDRGTFLIRGSSLGTGASISGGNGYLTLGTGPTLVGGGTGAGTTTISIVPWAIGDTSGSGSGTSFVTYGATTGFRPLSTSTEYAPNLTSGATTNARLIASTANAASVTVNSLALATSGAVTGAGTLNITSGAILNTNSSATIANTIAFPTGVEGVIFAPSAMTISGAMTGDAGLTISGATTSSSGVTFSGNNTGLTGALTINNGQVFWGAANNLPGSGAITISGRGSASAGLIYSGSTAATISRDIIVNNGWVDLRQSNASGGDVTYSGVISGNGGLFTGSTGVSRVSLTGANTYTGPTRINEGQIVINGDSSLGNGGGLDFFSGASAMGTTTIEGVAMTGNWTTSRNISFGSGGGVDTGAFNATWNGPVTGTGGLVKVGSGELRINSLNPFSGSVTLGQTSPVLAGGDFRLANDGGLMSTSYTANANSRIILDNSTVPTGTPSGAVTIDRVVDNAGVTLASGGRLTVLGNASQSVREVIGTLTATGSGNILRVESTGGQTSTLQIGNLILGSNALLVQGNQLGLGSGSIGRIFLSQFNTAAVTNGQILNNLLAENIDNPGVVEQGVYDTAVGIRLLDPVTDFSNGVAIQNAAPTSLATTANFRVNPVVANPVPVLDAANTINALRFAPNGTVDYTAAGNSTLTITSGSLFTEATGTAAITQGGAGVLTLTSGAAQLGVVTNANLTNAANIGGSGGISKSGNGTWNQNGNVANTGAVGINAGTANFNGTFSSGAITVGAAGTAAFNSGLTSTGALTVNGTASIGAASSAVGLAGASTGALTIGANNLTVTGSGSTYSGSITGSGTLAFNPFSSATFTFNGSSPSFSGAVNANNSTLFALGSGNGLGTGTITLGSAATSTSLIQFTAATSTVANNIVLPTAATGTYGLTNNTSLVGQTTTLSGVISGGTATQVFRASNGNADDSGTTVLTNANNTFVTSNIQVWEGVLAFTSDGALGAATNGLVLGTTSSTRGGIRFDAPNITLASTRGVNFADGNFINTNGFNGAIAGVVSGSGTFTKAGAGTLSLTGNSTHTGAITVNAGTLAMNGNYNGAGTVTVNTGGTLGGSGVIGLPAALRPTTIAAGGNLSPGNSPGILTINGNVTFAASSNFNVEINGFNVGTEYDRLVVNGTVTNAGNINVAFDSWAAPYVPYTGNLADPYLNDTWFILSNDGTDPTAAFANAAEGATISVGNVGGIAHTAQITYFADLANGTLTGGNDVALYNLIPTPSATALIGLGTILAGRRRRQA